MTNDQMLHKYEYIIEQLKHTLNEVNDKLDYYTARQDECVQAKDFKSVLYYDGILRSLSAQKSRIQFLLNTVEE